jgi:hypothetical protein
MYKYILSYDLNGRVPTHAQIDEQIRSIATEYARILETVWYIRTNLTLEQVYANANAILSANDRLIVVDARRAIYRNLLVDTASLQRSWAKAA